MREKKKTNLCQFKVIYDRLYRCRDLEIKNLWQRSIFLSVFLTLCFTGYGYLLINIIESNAFKIGYHFLAILLASIGTIFSCLWIMMAKGSKSWYEVYEEAISNFEDKHKIPDEYRMGKLNSERKNNNLFTTQGGSYSVSRINIAIGQITMVFWFLVMLVHSVIELIGFMLYWDCDVSSIFKIILLFLSFILPMITVGVLLLLRYQDKWVRSSYLQ